MSRSIATILIYAWSLGATGQEIDRRIDASPSGQLEVENIAGSIIVEGSNIDEVQVTGSLGPNVERLDVLTEGSRTIVRVVQSDNDGSRARSRDWWNEGTDLSIRAPLGMSVEISSVSADILTRNMRGEHLISGVSGDIRIEAFGAEVRARTVSGDILVEGQDELTLTQASAVSGDIDLDALSGEVEANSVSGDIEYRGRTLDRGTFETVSGDILINAEPSQSARLEATATSGDIELSLIGTGAGRYRLSTFSGEIDNCFGPAAADLGGRFGPPGQTLRFEEGSADARLEAKTHSGDIGVCRD